MELRQFNQLEQGIFGPILATYQNTVGVTFDTNNIAVDTAPDGTFFYHILAIRSTANVPTGSDIISVLLVLDVSANNRPGLAGIFLNGANGQPQSVSLLNQNGDLLYSSNSFFTMKYSPIPTNPQPTPSAMISDPSIGNLSHDGPGKWSGTIDVSVGIFSWDVIGWKYADGKFTWWWIN